MLGFGRFRWRTVTGGSKVVRRRDRRAARRRAPARAGGARSIRRDADGVELRTDDGELRRFDKVVVATHADEALALLEDPSDDERRVLGGFAYTRNDTVLHTDSSFLPRVARGARLVELPHRRRRAARRSPTT